MSRARTARRAGWLLLAAAPCAWPLTIEYAPDRAAALRQCDMQLYRGQRAEARACYARAAVANDDLAIKADAARAIGDLPAAAEFFDAALATRPDDAALRTRIGELYTANHDYEYAITRFQAALEIDPDYAPAKLGLAKIAAGRFEQETRELASEVIESSPDNSVEAYLLLARADLEDGALDAADDKLNRALAIVERREMPPLEVYAYKAAADFLRGSSTGDWTERALAYNPHYGDIYAIPAYFHVITRRYREAVALYRKAVEIEPENYSAHIELGVNLLRDNKVADAYRHLRIAHEGAQYERSSGLVNTLRLIDSFENFVVSTHAPAPTADNPLPMPDVILRLHKTEAEVLTPYVLDLTRRSIATYTERYGFKLQEPVVVELYPEHDDFAVRTSGLPGIGLLGVTFGYVVAMDSPTGRADSNFHWGTTLWHEMAHVFTLEATHHLVPRWFSEGVSVHEEWSTGPLDGRHIPPPFFAALAEKKLLPIVELDRGFVRPTYDSQVIVSYMQAGLTCEYIAGRFGQPALAKMLALYAEGAETDAAIEGALGISPQQFDNDFAAHVDGLFGEIAKRFEEWQEAQQAALAAAGEGEWSAALEAAERALAVHPDYVDNGSGYLIKARAERELGRTDQMRATLAEYRRRGGHDPDALLDLAAAEADAGHDAEALAILEDALMVAPLRRELHEDLGDRLLDANRPADAITEYRAFLAMRPRDLATAHYKLAKAYFAAGEATRSREQLLYALEIAPNYREAQQLLLEMRR